MYHPTPHQHGGRVDDDPRPGAAGARADGIPNANSPQLLTHLLEMIARGVRSNRALQEALGVDQRTVRYYIQAGEWLGLLVDDVEPLLSPEGLGYVYAGPGRRELYAQAVSRQPFVQDLLAASPGAIPGTAEIERAIVRAAPSLAASTVARRASSVRGLIQPYLDHLAERPEDDAPTPQLDLPLPQAPAVEPAPPLAVAAGTSFSPDIYRYILCYLLDHGELTLGHVRGLLDNAGAQDVPIGSYVDLAVARGDATKVQERLVVSPGAVERRELAAATASVILSDGGWRDHLEAIRKASKQEGEGVVRTTGRYRLWNRRLLGADVAPSALEGTLAQVLRDRSVDAWPRTTGPVEQTPSAHPAPFLDVWEESDLVVTLPPSLVQLWEGVAGVNRRLRNARHRADAVGSPTAVYRPAVVHGGLIHPGEPLPRAIADMRSLRQRTVRNAPYVTMLVALLYAHRSGATSLSVKHVEGSWWVHRHRTSLGGLLDLLDAFARHRGWTPSRRAHGGMTDDVLVSLTERLGCGVGTGDHMVLDDSFFSQLRDDDEASLLRDGLEGLGNALTGWLGALRQDEALAG